MQNEKAFIFGHFSDFQPSFPLRPLPLVMEIVLTLTVLVLALIAFVAEWLPVDITALNPCLLAKPRIIQMLIFAVFQGY